MSAGRIDTTVLIATYNRAGLLDETLRSVRALRVSPSRTWDVTVVDNNSSDDTRAVVERHMTDFPVPLQYVFESRQGRSSALNTGIALSAGTVIAFTDDDVLLDPGWLDAACDELSGSDPSIGYVGGPVRPIWEAPPPKWLELTRGDLWGTIAIQDHGDRRVVYEEAGKVPLGANMAAVRTMLTRIGGFRPDLGRGNGRLILGQEVPELLARARAAGFRGVYQPAMALRHHVPARRLTRQYFRRWWFGKGVSRAALERGQSVSDTGLDLTRVSRVLSVPRPMYGSAVRHAAGWLQDTLRGRTAPAFRHEMMLDYFAGYFWSSQRGDFAVAQRPAGSGQGLGGQAKG
jgi:glycosyltransferase involved in cell wall biosynthesis